MSQKVDMGVLARAEVAMARDRADYDFEKVFWRTLYGVGLFAVGMGTLKVGRMIQAVTNPVAAIRGGEYDLIVSFVEGKDMFKDPGGLTAHRDTIIRFRQDPVAYQDWKDAYAEAKAAAPPEIQMLDMVDSAAVRVGPVAPVAIFGLMTLYEYRRSRRMRRSL